MKCSIFPTLPASATLLGLLGLLGCAADVIRHPVSLTPASASATAQHVANRDVLIKLNSGYERTIRKDSVWRQVGTLPQGKVYRPEGGAFTVEGAHVHEAYLVVSSGKLVGFYLPVEKAYSALDTNPAQLWEE